jgi:uncharacterized protein
MHAWLSFQRKLESPFLLLAGKGRGIPAFAGMTVLLAILLLLLATAAHAQTFPKLTGRVVDAANLLSPEQEASLTQQLAGLETKNRRQLVVVTLPSLEGYAIEDYGYRLGRNWGIGEKDVNSGALLIVAPNERKVRIEVGYGLEPIVTDALSSVIIQQQILPAFRGGDMPAGIIAGTKALVDLLSLPDEQAEARAQRIVADAKQGEGGGFPIALIFWGIVLAVILLSMVRNRGAGRAFRRSGLPVILWGPGLGGGGGSGWGGGGGFGSGGGFSGGGGSFGGGGSSGSW